MNSAEKKYSWQTALANCITEPRQLFELLHLDLAALPQAEKATKLFPLRVTHSFLARMKKSDLNDPLLLQILPLGLEENTITGFSKDPLQENRVNPIPGLLHKYYGRVLLTLTSVCAINCRYCFRRYFPYADNNPGSQGWGTALTYIADDVTISEVILSGGDPLATNDKTLENLIAKLVKIPHVKRLRIHSRLPIVLPQRITDELIQILTATRLKIIIVIHCNHTQEIDASVGQAIAKLRLANISIYNQTVLLKNINDNVSTLVTLSEALFALDVQPYYLHTLDKVAGTAHFDIPLTAAKALHKEMQRLLPGYLVPKLATEQPEMPHKTLL